MQKYFRNQCTPEEIEQVIDWFQTEDGRKYFEDRLNRDMHRYADEKNLLLHPEVPSVKMLQKIERIKKKGATSSRRNRDHWWMRVAVILLISSMFAGSGYLLLQNGEYVENQEPELVYRTISTPTDQQRLVTLDDGTKIRLNTSSSIEIPEQFTADSREVTIDGEAYFEVAKDEDRLFSIRAGEAMIRVLGTEFNVRIDKRSRSVQIAVAEGRVSLSDDGGGNGSEAILSENTFALFHPNGGEILIEQSPVDNYMSWISGNLHFYDEPLWIVSRYLERLYGVSFRFRKEQLKELTLSANIIKRDLLPVLDIISQTLGIDYEVENDNDIVVWMDSK